MSENKINIRPNVSMLSVLKFLEYETWFALAEFVDNAIASYLNCIVNEINSVIITKKDQLATLDEYKKSIIYEYVTGKKEVN